MKNFLLLYNGFIEFVAEHCVLHLLRRLSYTFFKKYKNIVDNKIINLCIYGAHSALLRKYSEYIQNYYLKILISFILV